MKRRSKILLMASLSLIILALFVFYWVGIRTPGFALYQIYSSIENRDLVKFKKYVDIEGVISRLIDDTVAFASELDSNANASIDDLATGMVHGIVGILKPQLVTIGMSHVERFVETGKIEGDKLVVANTNQVDTGAQPDVILPWEYVSEYGWEWANIAKSATRRIQYVNQSGRIALVGFKYRLDQYNSDLLVEVKLRNLGQYWQLAEFSNWTHILKTIAQLRNPRASQGSAQTTVPDPIRQKALRSAIDSSVAFVNYKLDYIPENYMRESAPYTAHIRFFSQFQNKSPETITGIKYHVKFYDSFGDIVFENDYKENVKIKPGKTNKMDRYYYWEDNQFMGGEPYDKLYGCVSAGTCKVNVEITQVVFENGQVVG